MIKLKLWNINATEKDLSYLGRNLGKVKNLKVLDLDTNGLNYSQKINFLRIKYEMDEVFGSKFTKHQTRRINIRFLE